MISFNCPGHVHVLWRRAECSGGKDNEAARSKRAASKFRRGGGRPTCCFPVSRQAYPKQRTEKARELSVHRAGYRTTHWKLADKNEPTVRFRKGRGDNRQDENGYRPLGGTGKRAAACRSADRTGIGRGGERSGSSVRVALGGCGVVERAGKPPVAARPFGPIHGMIGDFHQPKGGNVADLIGGDE